MSWPTFRDGASQAVGRQLSNPSGVGGRLVGRIMGIANRLPVRALIQALEIRNEHRVLDVGCGDGSALAAIPHAAWRCGVDRSETMLAVARRRLRGPIDQRQAELLLGDMMKLPFEAGSFDRFIAANTLYFCEDVPAFIDGCRRVALPGALLGIYVTSAASMARWRFAGPATHRHFTREQLEFELDQAKVDLRARSIRPLWLPGAIEGLIAIARLD
jgi:SAM-dependent methyltransferase